MRFPFRAILTAIAVMTFIPIATVAQTCAVPEARKIIMEQADEWAFLYKDLKMGRPSS